MNTMEYPIDPSITENLLIYEPAILFYPSIAVSLSLNEAIVLGKLDNLLEASLVIENGYKWVKQSYDNWQLHFPFWSTRTISRIILKLEKRGCLHATIEYNEFLTDKTKWYRIDYERLAEFL